MGNFSILTSLTLNSAGFNKGLDEANSKVKSFGKNAKSSFGGISSLLPTIGIGLMVGAMANFSSESYKAYEEQEKANKRLKTALNGNVQAFEQLTAASAKLQSETGIDEGAISQIQLLAVSAGYTTKEVNRLVEASVALSSLTGKDLQASYLQLSKSLDGSAGKLGAVDAEILTLTKDQLKNGAAIDLMIYKHSDLAKESATVSEKVAVNWGEIKESIGGSIATVLNPALESLNESLKSLNEMDMSNFEKFIDLAVNKGANMHLHTQMRLFNEEVDKGAKGVVNYIKNVGGFNYLLKGIQTMNSVKKDKPTNNTNPVKESVGEYQKLQKTVSELNVELQNMYASGVKPSEDFLYNLKLQEQKLIDIGNAVSVAKNGLDSYIQIQEDIEIPDNGDYSIDYGEDMTIQPDNTKAETYQNQIDEINNITKSGLESLSGTFAQGIADMITGDGGLGGFFAGLLGSIGGFLKQMGAAIMSYGIAMEAFKKAFTNPYVAIAAGIALMVTGGIVSNYANQLNENKFANGGIVGGNSFSGDMITARLNSGEMVLNKSQQSNLFQMANGGSGSGGQVEFKIRGQELIGVLSNSSKKRSNSI